MSRSLLPLTTPAHHSRSLLLHTTPRPAVSPDPLNPTSDLPISTITMIPDPRDTIHLGVEIELLLSGRNVAVSSWWEVAEDISGLMCQAGIDTEVTENIEELPVRWAVTTDASLSDSRHKEDPMFIRPNESTLFHPVLPWPSNLC